ncbi:MAG: SRPBCC family protein [Phycisphaerae bacterium]
MYLTLVHRIMMFSVALLLVAGAPLGAQDEKAEIIEGLPKDAPSAATDDESVLRWEQVVDATLDEAWDAFTREDDIEDWMVPICKVDLRVGGTIQTNYNRDMGVGGPGTITHHILAFEPKRMLSMRFTAPANAPVAKVAEAAWGVTRFNPISATQTLITYSSCGWGKGEDWDKARAFFEKGNKYTFDKLAERFAKRRARQRAVSNEAVVTAPAEEIWWRLTRKIELTTWHARDVEVDFSIGGSIRSNAMPDSFVGDSGTRTFRILSYEPQRMLAYREEIPEILGESEWVAGPTTVIRLDPKGSDTTHVSIVTSGFETGAEWDRAYEHFQASDSAWLAGIRALNTFSPRDRALETIARFVGGEWIFDEKTPSGATFRGRNRWQQGPGGKSFFAQGHIGDERGLSPHGNLQVFVDPADNAVKFLNIDESGNVTRGRVLSEGADAIVLEWNQMQTDGTVHPFDVRMTFADADTVKFIVTPKFGEHAGKAMPTVTHRRVDAAPPEFRRIRQAE